MLCYAKLLQPASAHRLPALPCAISRKCCIGREECTLGVGGGRVPERLYEVWIKSGEGARAVFEMCSVMGICLSREAWSIVLGRHSELWSALLLCQSISTSSPVCAPLALNTHCPRSQKGDQMRYAIWIYYDAYWFICATRILAWSIRAAYKSTQNLWYCGECSLKCLFPHPRLSL